MPKKKSKDTPAEQSRRFVETAKALGVDESGKAFERAVSVIAPKRVVSRPHPSVRRVSGQKP